MLWTLPNELLLEIYQSLGTLQSAVDLSRSNRRLHDIWLLNQGSLTISLLKSRIPAYDDAIKVAILDVYHELISPEDPSIQLHLLEPRLLQNAKMCQRVGNLYKEERDRNPVSYLDLLGLEMDKPGIYYDFLMVAHAHDLPTLRRTVRRRLKRLSREERCLYLDFGGYVLETCEDAEVLHWHDFKRPKPELASTSYYEWCDNPLKDRWKFTLCTLGLYERLPPDYDYRDTGEYGFWTDNGENNYRPEWK